MFLNLGHKNIETENYRVSVYKLIIVFLLPIQMSTAEVVENLLVDQPRAHCRQEVGCTLFSPLLAGRNRADWRQIGCTLDLLE